MREGSDGGAAGLRVQAAWVERLQLSCLLGVRVVTTLYFVGTQASAIGAVGAVSAAGASGAVGLGRPGGFVEEASDVRS